MIFFPQAAFSLELDHPWAGALVLAASLAAFGYVLRGSRPRPRHLVRALLALTVALAASGPRARDPDPPRTRIFVVDRSRSFARARASVLAALEGGARDLDPSRDRICAVAFGAAPVLACDVVPASEAPFVASAALQASVDPLGSDLASALDLAREKALQAGGACEVVLLSDGRDTSGRTREAAALLGASSIPVHVVAPSVPVPPNARLARLSLPRSAAPGEPVRAWVEVETTVRSRVRVRLEARGARALGEQEVEGSCEPGSPLRLSFRMVADEPGVATVSARVRLLEARDELPEDDSLEEAFVVGEGARAVLVRGLAPRERDPWRELLAQLHFQVEERSASELSALGNPVPALVVLDDVPASALPQASVDALGRLVASGSALMVAGDERAFGPGGYPGSPLEELLPVRSGPPDDRGKPLALEIVLDASGSMGTHVEGGRSRFVAALDAAIPRERELRAGDLLGIVLFSSEPRVARPLSTLAGTTKLLADLTRIEPSGGTDVARGLVAGLGELASRDARRLLVLITDGEDPKAQEQLEAVRAAAAPIEKGELDVALVLVGEDTGGKGRATLEALAGAVGKRARVFLCSEAGPELAKLVRGELLPESRHERRTGAFPVVSRGSAAGLPAISSYAPVRARELSETLLSVRDPEREGEAPLAVARERVLALATSLSRGGAPLASSAGRDVLVALLRRVAPAGSDELELVATRARGSVRVVATQRSIDPTRGDLVVVASGRSGETLAPLVPIAPGKLAATLPSRDRESVLVRARPRAGGPAVAVTQVPAEATLELAPPLRGTETLAEIARLSGNERAVAPELGPLPRPVLPRPARREIAGELALLALLLLLLEGAIAVFLERLAARRAAGSLS